METEGGGFLTQRFFGIPAWVFLLGAAALAYWYFSRQGGIGGGGASSSAGSNDTLTSGNTTVDTGAVQVTVNTGNTQPGPPSRGKTTTVTVPDVVGKPYPSAAQTIRQAGLKPVKQKGFKGNTVEGERPYRGAKVRRNTAITLIGSSE